LDARTGIHKMGQNESRFKMLFAVRIAHVGVRYVRSGSRRGGVAPLGEGGEVTSRHGLTYIDI